MELLFASGNENKANEIRKKLPQNLQLRTLKELQFTEEIEETGKTLEENAQIKAHAVAAKFQLPCFADDSGLEITALGGAPGVRSARYAGEEKDDEKNRSLVLQQLANETDRRACFRTVIAYYKDGQTHLFEGKVEGRITKEQRGTNGFGYDPIFIPDGADKTFAEMTMEEKNQQSHRAMAVQKFIAFLEENRT